jgi:hypothetical protein
VVELFPIGYLTLVAIIQGAAFGLLFLTLQSQLTPLVWSAHTAMTLTQAIATGLTIVIVTHEYLLLTVDARWVPTVFDTLIPYLLGLSEIWMAISTGHPISWWIAMSSVCLTAILAFSHTRIRSARSAARLGLTEKSRAVHQRSVLTQALLSVVMLAPSVTLVFLNHLGICPIWLNISMTWGVVMIGVLVLGVGEHDQNALYDEYGIQRWRPLARSRPTRLP